MRGSQVPEAAPKTVGNFVENPKTGRVIKIGGEVFERLISEG